MLAAGPALAGQVGRFTQPMPGVAYTVTILPPGQCVNAVPNPNPTVLPTITLPSHTNYGGPSVNRVTCSMPVTIIT